MPAFANCSLRALVYIAADGLEMIQNHHGTCHCGRIEGKEDLVLYQFNTKTAKHYFCRHCGIHPFVRPRLDPGQWACNVRCINGVELASLKVSPFDGQNWEATARAYYERLVASKRV